MSEPRLWKQPEEAQKTMNGGWRDFDDDDGAGGEKTRELKGKKERLLFLLLKSSLSWGKIGGRKSG